MDIRMDLFCIAVYTFSIRNCLRIMQMSFLEGKTLLNIRVISIHTILIMILPKINLRFRK
jgi:hypothetical protein